MLLLQPPYPCSAPLTRGQPWTKPFLCIFSTGSLWERRVACGMDGISVTVIKW